MAIYICIVCNHIYDDKNESIPFEQLLDDFVCPVCGSSKAYFKVIEE